MASDKIDYQYDCQLVRILDGDTVELHLEKSYAWEVDFGFKIKDVVSFTKSTNMIFRIFGINTPEVHGEQRVEGEKSKAELARLLALGPLTVKTRKPDKYGRWLGEIEVRPPDGSIVNISKALIAGGFAKPYFGQGAKE